MQPKKHKMSSSGKIIAVDCAGCRIRTDGVKVAALGLTNISIRVTDGVVYVKKVCVAGRMNKKLGRGT